MTPDWLKRLKSSSTKGPDLAKPIPVGDPMKDLRSPLPDPERDKRLRRIWNWRNRNESTRQWTQKERQA